MAKKRTRKAWRYQRGNQKLSIKGHNTMAKKRTRKAWRYQRGNQKLSIKGQTTQWPKKRTRKAWRYQRGNQKLSIKGQTIQCQKKKTRKAWRYQRGNQKLSIKGQTIQWPIVISSQKKDKRTNKTMIYKTLHRKLRIEHHKHHWKNGAELTIWCLQTFHCN